MWTGWRVTPGWERTFERPSKISTEENESTSRKRSQAAITTACCNDGGDKEHTGVNRKLAVWTSAHPVVLHFEPKEADQKSLTPFKGVVHRSDEGHVQESGWEVHNVIRTSHQMVSPLLWVCVCLGGGFFIFVYFSVFFVAEIFWQRFCMQACTAQ